MSDVQRAAANEAGGEIVVDRKSYGPSLDSFLSPKQDVPIAGIDGVPEQAILSYRERNNKVVDLPNVVDLRIRYLEPSAQDDVFRPGRVGWLAFEQSFPTAKELVKLGRPGDNRCPPGPATPEVPSDSRASPQ